MLNVLCILGMKSNLLSIGQLIVNNYKVLNKEKMMTVHDSTGRLILKIPMLQNRTLHVELDVLQDE